MHDDHGEPEGKENRDEIPRHALETFSTVNVATEA
jgi:hypothetical protein